MKKILSFGASHSKFWNNYHETHVRNGVFMGIDCLHVGPATAHKLLSPTSTAQALPKLRAHLAEHCDVYGALIFSFGTTDCECYVVPQALAKNSTIEAEAHAIADAYADVVRAFAAETGLPCLIYGPPPVSRRSLNHDSLVTGSITERNFAIMCFNDRLRRVVHEGGDATVGFFSIFDDLIAPNREVKRPYFGDGIHPDLEALDLGEAALRRELARLGLLETYAPALVRSWPIAARPNLRNVAVGMPIRVRTTHCGHPTTPFPTLPDGNHMFHTDTEDEPEVVIELDATYFVKTIKVHNRSICQERAETITVAFAHAGKPFEDVFRSEERISFGANTDCLVIELAEPRQVRLVKLYLRERTALHLQCVELWALTFDSQDQHVPARAMTC